MNWNQSLTDYQHYLKIERGLSVNTVQNYALDVNKLIVFLSDNNIDKSPTQISAEILQQFIYSIAKSVNARSQSRIISGLRSFFDYLVFENY
ncbi:MAG: site-specific integrase, partial [Flavobacteriaceae bacterium]|nr:site-specific integrase [Flavobacteriaceae bacterium]